MMVRSFGELSKVKLSGNELKTIALSAMFIQHLAIANVVTAYYNQLLAIGRVTLPIIIFLLVEGIYHTRNKLKYFLNLAIAMVISEIPYRLAFKIDLTQPPIFMNIFSALILSFLFAMIVILIQKYIKNAIVMLAVLIAFFILANIFEIDYNIYPIVLVLIFVGLRENIFIRNIFLYFTFVLEFEHFLLGLVVILLLNLYDGKRSSRIEGGDKREAIFGEKAVKYGYYLFYPVHFLLIYVIKILM